MKQFEFRAFVTSWGENENQARKNLEQLIVDAQESEPNLEISLDDSEGEEIEDE